MEDITPTLRLILSLREGLERGESLRFCLGEFCEKDQSGIKLKTLRLLHAETNAKDADRPDLLSFEGLKDTEKSLFGVILRGLRGEPILNVLKDLENDLVERSDIEIDEFTQKLSFLCLLPLLILVFPGYLFLLIGPLLENLILSLQ